MTELRLKPDNIKVWDLIQDYLRGKILIPEFQRGYVWQPSKAAKLIDSLYNNYPISSLLLWSTHQDIRTRDRENRNHGSHTVKWLIDGQQRVRTLAACVTGETGHKNKTIDVVFHPDDEEFTHAKAAGARDQNNWYRLADIWDDDTYRHIRQQLLDHPKGQTREMRLERVRAIREYHVPAVYMEGHSLEQVVEAFRRINTGGVRLKGAEIQSARVAAQHTGFIAERILPFLDARASEGFTRLAVMHLFRACEFIASPDTRNRASMDKLNKRELESAWAKTEQATQEAIDFVRGEFGLINMDLLWSGALLVPVIAFCATHRPKEKDTKAITAWLASAALWHRYSRSSDTALEQDIKACYKDDPIRELLDNIERCSSRCEAIPEDFDHAMADKSALLAMYIACYHKGCQDLFSGAKILQQDNIERHHIFPRARFRDGQNGNPDCLANIAFISGPANKAVGDDDPGQYLAKVAKRILESQCIPTDRRLWRIDRAEEFWQARRKLLANAFNDYLRNSLPRRQIRDAA